MGRKHKLVFLFMVIILTGLIACEKLLPEAPPDDSILDGPIDGLSQEQKKMFLRGDRAFNDEIFTEASGLGPIFVASSCGTCHAGD
jgi:hypothetical protein